MELQPFTVESREESGKGPAGRMRHDGHVPGIIYGDKKDNSNISVSIKELDHLIHGAQGEHALVDLTVEGNDDLNGPVILKEVQHHPVTGRALHFDFQRIDLNKKIQTVVPIKLEGHSVGIIAGGVLDHHIREAHVECLPLDTPVAIIGDITELDIAGRFHISDLNIPENVTVLNDESSAVASIHKPRVAKADEAAAADAGEEAAEEATEEAAE